MSQTDTIIQPITAELADFREHFTRVLSHDDTLLGQVLAFIRQRQGKLMRPVLVLLTAKAVGQVINTTHHAAMTLELLHTASLVHDDVVDDSHQRRGQAAVHTVFDNKSAVLVGDYLLSLALEESAFTGSTDIVGIIARLGKTLSQGEILQLDNVRRTDFCEDTYYRIISEKTATLFEACTLLGALSSGADEAYREPLRRLGHLIGMSFQIRDDIFDYFADDVGKPTGNDLQEGKITLPLIFALNKTQDQDMRRVALRVREGEATAEEVASLVQFAKDNGGIDYAEQRMQALAQEAHSIIDSLPKSEAQGALHLYLDYVLQRKL